MKALEVRGRIGLDAVPDETPAHVEYWRGAGPWALNDKRSGGEGVANA